MNNWFEANWPAPDWLHAGTSLRTGGISKNEFSNFNLAHHVNDPPTDVAHNREILSKTLKLPKQPLWLNQVHGNAIINADSTPVDLHCDGTFTNQSGTVVAVLTADCLPLLMCDVKNQRVAAIHVGWRGFCKGMVEEAIKVFSHAPASTLAWLGPCISQQHYEVDKTVRNACLQQAPNSKDLFAANRSGHWLMDLKGLVKQTLVTKGIESVFDSATCTFSESERWYSFRRDGNTGRMASLIWME